MRSERAPSRAADAARAEARAGSLAEALRAVGREARREVGARDVAQLRALQALSTAGELIGRLLLHLPGGPVAWCAGVASLALHLGLEAQLNHVIQHGTYEGLPGAERYARARHETLALPLQTRTWREAHRIHHAEPSRVGRDPDTVHPLFRVHPADRWRPWHRLNGLLGTLWVFECWGRDYDRYLKAVGVRARDDRGERRKLLSFLAYQYLLFPLLAGPRALEVLAGTALAVVLRNVVFVFLQTASSVGARVSMAHAQGDARLRGEAWARFQVETSKNYRAPWLWTLLSGGLDRHIEHHLFPTLPATRLRAVSPAVRALCEARGVTYEEHASPWSSFADSARHLARLARRDHGAGTARSSTRNSAGSTGTPSSSS